LENDLEDTIFRFYPLIQEHKRRLLLQQPELALVSGSGAAVFGLFPEEEQARAALQALPADSRTRLVEMVSRDRYWESVSAGV
jgi:4-diphosphocytidyl-2-C-methyl-D-erythritol kinase